MNNIRYETKDSKNGDKELYILYMQVPAAIKLNNYKYNII